MEHDKDSDETRVVPNTELLFLPPITWKLTSQKEALQGGTSSDQIQHGLDSSCPSTYNKEDDILMSRTCKVEDIHLVCWCW